MTRRMTEIALKLAQDQPQERTADAQQAQQEAEKAKQQLAALKQDVQQAEQKASGGDDHEDTRELTMHGSLAWFSFYRARPGVKWAVISQRRRLSQTRRPWT